MKVDFRFMRKMSVRTKILLVFLFCLYSMSILLFSVEVSCEKEREYFIKKFREFQGLSQEYQIVRKSTEVTGNIRTSQGILNLINSVIYSTNLNDRVKHIKTTGVRQFKELVEEGVDVRIDKLSMNEMINFLYKIENQGLTVKDIRLKKDFESPDRLNMELKIFMYTRSEEGRKG